MREISSTCPYCGVGCGVTVSVDDSSSGFKDKPLVLASETHPANLGRLCSKGSALGETLDQTRARTKVGSKEWSRVTHPTIDGELADWGQATSAIADKIQHSIDTHGAESVAFYLSGQLLTEDYYVANKLMKGFIGTANVDTNSRLCMSSAVAAYKRAFGGDVVPCSYEDLEEAELIILIGSNAAWTHPVLYQRMVSAKQANPDMRVVLIDPRRTVTEDLADLHLQLAPSSDGYLFQGLLNFIINSSALDNGYVEKFTEGFEAAKESVARYSIKEVAVKTSLSESDITTFYEWFAETRKTVSFYSQGINQSATGTDKCNAIINCHLASGKMGYPGAGPFSITGQPNAMGGREVGGLSNQLAAHMDFSAQDTDRVQRFWQSPSIASQPGLKAVELFDAIGEGKIKVLWIMATNPAVSLPNSAQVRAALEKCPTVIVSDVCHTDTSHYADIVLPAKSWSEKDGTVTNSERRISRQRAFRKAPEVAKPDWWALKEVAHKLGFQEYFDYGSARDVFVEHAELSGFENGGTRGFDISRLAALSSTEYDELAPIQWPVTASSPNGMERMFEDGVFFTDSRRARFVISTPVMVDHSAAQFTLNTGRIRDQWHTMTRTGTAPSLTGHDEIPFVEIHPDDAAEYKLEHDQFARVYNQFGDYVAQVKHSSDISRRQLFSPIHWTDQFATNGVVSHVVSPEVDPVSGQPESKASAVSIESYDCAVWARVLSAEPISREGWRYWAKYKTSQGFGYVLGTDEEHDWADWATSQNGQAGEIAHFMNPLRKSETLILSVDDTQMLAVHVHKKASELPSAAWLNNAFSNTALPDVLRGESGDADKLICSCFATTEQTIRASIEAGSANVEELAGALGCGSKCGSCRPELKRLLAI